MRRRRHQRQLPPPAPSQPLHRDLGVAPVVEVEVGMLDPHVGPPVRRERKPPLVQIAHPRVLPLGPREHDPVRRPGLDDVAHRVERIAPEPVGRDDQMVGRRRQILREAVDHMAGQPEDLVLDRQHQADDVGLPRPEPHPGPVRPVADLLRDQPHPLLGRLPDVRRIVQRPRHGGHPEPGHVGDGLQRRPARLRRLRRPRPRARIHPRRPSRAESQVTRFPGPRKSETLQCRPSGSADRPEHARIAGCAAVVHQNAHTRDPAYAAMP